MSHGPHDQGDRRLPPPYVEEVAERIYAYIQPDGTWWINNTGFVAGDGLTMAVDTCATEKRTRAFVDAVRRCPAPAPRLLVNTHHHGDHTNGNCLLPEAVVIGHRLCRQEVLRAGILDPGGVFEPVDWGELSVAPPFVTFDDRLDLHVGDRLVELHHFGTAAHTTNDLVAWLPEQRVLFSGDLVFNGATPLLVMGSLSGTLTVLDRLVELEPEVIVPGHGPPCGPEVLDVVGSYVRFVQVAADEARSAGLTPLEAARQIDLGQFADLSDPERLAGNLHRAYAECEGVRPGADIDLAAAFGDMMALAGNRPLRCLA